MSRVIYQLDAFGRDAKPCHAWERRVTTWFFCGIPLPISEDAKRQHALLSEKASVNAGAETLGDNKT